MIRAAGLRILTDQFVRQGFYPSRVLVARTITAGAKIKIATCGDVAQMDRAAAS